MAPLGEQEALHRKSRFRNAVLPSGVAMHLFRMLGEASGLQVSSAAELQALERENQALRREHISLSGLAGKVAPSTTTWSEERCRAVASVTLGFELVPRRCNLPELPRKASFQIVEFA